MRYVLVLVLLVAVGVFACGDDDDSDGSPTPSVFTEIRAIGITDNAFDPADFTVPAGSIVLFELTSTGGNLHNFRIAGPDGDYETDDDTLSDPDEIGNGVIVTVPWSAPQTPGEVEFRCDFHPEEMTGAITVK